MYVHATWVVGTVYRPLLERGLVALVPAVRCWVAQVSSAAELHGPSLLVAPQLDLRGSR